MEKPVKKINLVLMSLLILLLYTGQINSGKIFAVINYSPTNTKSIDKFYTRGCCSHHGGVCGCNSDDFTKAGL